MREHRPKYRDLTDDQKRKVTCRAYTNELVRRGKLKRTPCEECGDKRVHAYHQDFNDPKRVKWLCWPCRRRLYGVERPVVQSAE